LQHLIVTAKPITGVEGSGTVTVEVNGSVTSITCSLGTTSRCIDDTHTVSVSDHDLIVIKFQQGPGAKYEFVRARLAKV
jgi:hypothetical protein